MKEQAIQKINKIGKVSYIIAIIAKILVIAFIVCTLAGAVICFGVPAEAVKVTMSGGMKTEVDYASLGQTLSASDREALEAMMENEEDIRVESYQTGVVDGGLGVQIREQKYVPVNVEVTNDMVVMDMVAEGDPFTMREMGGILLVVALTLVMTLVTLCFVAALCKAFRNCASPFEQNVIKKMQNLAISLIPWTLISSIGDSIWESAMSGGMQLMLNLDLGVVLVVLVVLVLVYIFKYGAVLQQESDETL